MGLDAQMMIRCSSRLQPDVLHQLNHDLFRTFYEPLGIHGYVDQMKEVPIKKTTPDDFAQGPGEDLRIPPEHRSGEWYWVHLSGRYYGKGYENGNIWGFVGVAEWLEFRVPGIEIWYGSDAHDFLEPFPRHVREELVRHFFAIGHGAFANP